MILRFLITDSRDAQNELQQDLWRARHAHADVLLALAHLALC